MLIDQLEKCRAAVADDREKVTLLDGKTHNAIAVLRETATGLAEVADEIVAMTVGAVN